MNAPWEYFTDLYIGIDDIFVRKWNRWTLALICIFGTSFANYCIRGTYNSKWSQSDPNTLKPSVYPIFFANGELIILIHPRS